MASGAHGHQRYGVAEGNRGIRALVGADEQATGDGAPLQQALFFVLEAGKTALFLVPDLLHHFEVRVLPLTARLTGHQGRRTCKLFKRRPPPPWQAAQVCL